MSNARLQTIAVLQAMRSDLFELIAQINNTLLVLQGKPGQLRRPYDIEPASVEDIATKYGVDLDPDGDIPEHIAARIRHILDKETA